MQLMRRIKRQRPVSKEFKDVWIINSEWYSFFSCGVAQQRWHSGRGWWLCVSPSVCPVSPPCDAQTVLTANRLSLPWPPTILTSLLAFPSFLMRLTATDIGFVHIMSTTSHCPQLWAPECQIWGMLWHTGLALTPPSHTDTLFTVTLH